MKDYIKINDCTLTISNESAFYNNFYIPYRATIYKRVDKNTFDLDIAVNGLQERIRKYFKSIDNLDTCRYLYKYKPLKYILNKGERVEVAKNLIEAMLTEKNEQCSKTPWEARVLGLKKSLI